MMGNLMLARSRTVSAGPAGTFLPPAGWPLESTTVAHQQRCHSGRTAAAAAERLPVQQRRDGPHRRARDAPVCARWPGAHGCAEHVQRAVSRQPPRCGRTRAGPPRGPARDQRASPGLVEDARTGRSAAHPIDHLHQIKIPSHVSRRDFIWKKISPGFRERQQT